MARDALAALIRLRKDVTEDADAVVFHGHNVADSFIIDHAQVEARFQFIERSRDGTLDVPEHVLAFMHEQLLHVSGPTRLRLFHHQTLHDLAAL